MSIYDQVSLVNTGIDFSLANGEEGGDFELTTSGDFKTINSVDNIKKAIMRRFYTGLGQIGVVNLDKLGLLYQDFNYGSELYKALSEPLDQILLDKVKTLTRQFLDQELRISVQDIRTIINSNQIILEVDYKIVNTSETDTVILSYDPSKPSGTA